MNSIVDRKETIVKRTVTALQLMRFLVIPTLLLWGRGTLLHVQAANEMQMQTETVMEETQPETEEVQTEAVSEVTQPHTEGASTEVQADVTVDAAQTEVTSEDAQSQTEGTAEEIQEQAQVPVEEPQAENVAEEAQTPLPVTMVGDSVMLGASPAILGMLPDCVIDAKVSRQVNQAHGVLDSLESQAAIRQTVVIGLGTNGPFSTALGQELINRLGSDRTIYWVTVYGRDLSWQEDSNATIRALAEANENVHIIDWAQAAAQHPEWICADGIHLSAAGRDGYAGIILAGLL